MNTNETKLPLDDIRIVNAISVVHHLANNKLTDPVEKQACEDVARELGRIKFEQTQQSFVAPQATLTSGIGASVKVTCAEHGDTRTDGCLSCAACNGTVLFSASENERLRTDCAEAYQVVGHLAEMAGVFDDPQVVRALDNLDAAACDKPRVHDSVLPFAPTVQASGEEKARRPVSDFFGAVPDATRTPWREIEIGDEMLDAFARRMSAWIDADGYFHWNNSHLHRNGVRVVLEALLRGDV